MALYNVNSYKNLHTHIYVCVCLHNFCIRPYIQLDVKLTILIGFVVRNNVSDALGVGIDCIQGNVSVRRLR